MGSDLLEFFERASADDYDSPHDPKFLRSMGLIVPKNSGVQMVWKDINLTQFLAKNIHWKFVPYAVAMAKADEYGIVSITSENGAGVKAFNTNESNRFTQVETNPYKRQTDGITIFMEKTNSRVMNNDTRANQMQA